MRKTIEKSSGMVFYRFNEKIKNKGDMIMLAKERSEEVVQLCSSLVKIPSLSGEERKVAEYIKQYAEKIGFDQVQIDELGNVAAIINGHSDGPTIVLDGHIDTVPVQESNWDEDPFSGSIHDGKIFGRGTSDMKGAVSAMLLAASYYARDCDKNFPGKVVVSCSVHEECFEGVATRNVSAQFKPDYVVIGEATNLQLNNGQRGRAEILLETFGKPAHSSNPEAGINAVNKMVTLLSKIQKLEVSDHPVLGKGILELTDIISSPYPGASVIPSRTSVTFDRRLLVNETRESVLRPIEELIDESMKEDPELKAKVSFSSGNESCYTGSVIEAERFFPAWLFDKDEPFIHDTFENLKKVLPETAISHYSFCTNGSHFAGEANIPTLGFGPSLEKLAHIDNEYIEIGQLEKAVTGYMSIIGTLINLKDKGNAHV
ncbi:MULTISPECIES: YgeY family selenium metabolism-linked hydrolase [unclassified Sporosarcina]|uniref:YgeY family selenium metabolism-linked hydrolase n=1 Tax=unclassified Sporosarcina TaxID=2647733 RepID=UPI00203E61D6|nr:MULTISPECIES: YgeY family selenium metabolism-linked hydrolase [unclassified Sporosarcina]